MWHSGWGRWWDLLITWIEWFSKSWKWTSHRKSSRFSVGSSRPGISLKPDLSITSEDPYGEALPGFLEIWATYKDVGARRSPLSRLYLWWPTLSLGSFVLPVSFYLTQACLAQPASPSLFIFTFSNMLGCHFLLVSSISLFQSTRTWNVTLEGEVSSPEPSNV